MKPLRQVCVATILSLTFTVTALAGDIHCPGVTSTGDTTSTEILIEVVLAVISIAAF